MVGHNDLRRERVTIMGIYAVQRVGDEYAVIEIESNDSDGCVYATKALALARCTYLADLWGGTVQTKLVPDTY